MRYRKLGIAAAGLTMSLAVFGGCSTKYTADDLKKQLTTGDKAMSQEQANCIVDGLVAKGVPLDKYGDPSPDDSAKITAVVTDCVTKTLSTTPGLPTS